MAITAVYRKRVKHWSLVSAIWLIRILPIRDILAFDLPRPYFKTNAPLMQNIDGGPIKRMERWIIHRVPPYIQHMYTIKKINNNGKELSFTQIEKISRNNIFRRVRLTPKQRMNEIESTPIIDDDVDRSDEEHTRTLPRRSPRFRRYRMNPMREQERTDRVVLPLKEKQVNRSGQPMFWRRINKNMNRNNKPKLDPTQELIKQIDILEWNDTTLMIQNSPTKIPITDTSIRNKSLNDLAISGSDGRVKFSAQHQESRSITMDDSYLSLNLLNEYMSRPISSFSIRSFHDDEVNSTSSPPAKNNKTKSIQRRRWLVRKLTISEALQDGVSNVDLHEERYFRLAVPLMPLVGINLTPVVDFEVLSVQRNNFLLKSEETINMMKIRSMRLSLLSRDDEVEKAMAERREKIQVPRPTKVSQNENLREIGNNAIEMVSKIEDRIKPYFSFDATITWTDREKFKPNEKRKQYPEICIKASTMASFTWNQTTVVHPFILEKISGGLLKRALKFGLVQMLTQIEKDFKLWARLPKSQ